MPAKASTDLFDLIKSLDTGEKRYFKLQAQLQKGAKKYLDLFDAIDKQEEYNEARIRERFSDEPFVRQLSVTKNYLYNQILDALDAYIADPALEVRRLTHKAEILINRSLLEQAAKVLKRAHEAADKGEYFSELFPIFALELRLEFETAREYSGMFEVCQGLQAQIETTIEQLRNLCQYSFGVSKYSFIYKDAYRRMSREEVDAKVEALLEDPLLKDPQRPLSRRARAFYHETRGRIFLTIGRHLDGIEEDIRVVENDGQNLEIAGVENYIVGIHNLATSCIAAARFDVLPGLIDRLEELAANRTYSRPGRIQARIQYSIDFCRMYHMLGTGEFGNRDYSDVHQHLDNFRELVGDRRTSKILVPLTVLHMHVKQYDHALHHAMQFLNDTSPAILRDFHVVMRMCALVCLYESGEVMAVEHGLKALKRFTNHPTMSTEYEQKMFKMLYRLVRVKSTPEEGEAFADVNASMNELFERQSGYAVVLLRFFRDWVAEKHAQFS